MPTVLFAVVTVVVVHLLELPTAEFSFLFFFAVFSLYPSIHGESGRLTSVDRPGLGGAKIAFGGKKDGT